MDCAKLHGVVRANRGVTGSNPGRHGRGVLRFESQDGEKGRAEIWVEGDGGEKWRMMRNDE